MLRLSSPEGGSYLQIRPELKKVLRRLAAKDDLCVSCAEAKITSRRLPLSSASNFVPGAVVAIDIFHGPCVSSDKKKYCLLVTDLATGHLEPYFLHDRHRSRHSQVREVEFLCRSACPSAAD